MNPGALLHKITPYLTNGQKAIAAVLANHPYPARDLLITLAVVGVVAWGIFKLIPKKK